MKIETLNIKEGFPPADLAVANMEIAIERFSKTKDTKVLKVIHGYGSHGVGGEIKRSVKIRLSELKKQHKIDDFVCGEQFGETVKSSYYILENFPELLIDSDLKNYNSGITLVFLKNNK
ncbi:MAG: hypothetical protein IKR12_02620 [Clostridia bacterium]|nr:hypothetical protein [Clostridia bacterium]